MGPKLSLSLEEARALPKVLLHDHLDGGLRPETIVQLADAVGHSLPTTDLEELVAYFRRGADARDILQYLETFGHTVPLLQTAENLHRVASEAALDLAADGVIYAEVRFAPELHVGIAGSPLSLDDAIEAVSSGFADAVADPSTTIKINTIVCAMRTEQRSVEVAEACVRWLDRGIDGAGRVVAFDLAGAETGFPPTDHAAAVAIAREGLARLTVHASEAPGLELISQALEVGAERIGHGVRLIEDCELGSDGLILGSLARSVRDRQIPLELCPSCNVQIGAVPTLAEHPIGDFLRAGFKATINTDNRLMSGVSASSELADVATTFGLSTGEVQQLLLNGAEASFANHDIKQQVIAQINASS